MSDIVERLRGIYRVPITDGLGPAGGDEPNNPHEHVRTFPRPPIQLAAADEIASLRALLAECAESMAAELSASIPEHIRLAYPSEQRRYDRDTALVLKARAAAEGSP